MKISTARTVVAVAVFGAVGVSLATHAATGTLSAIGYDSIALLCPLGALEVMLGAREFLLHPLLLLLLTIAVTLVVGKAFCGWLCPTPLLQRLFRGKKSAEGAQHAAGNDDRSCAAGSCDHGCSGCNALKPVGGKRDGFHIDSRFAVLGGALASTALFGFPVFCLVCPIGLTFATFIGLWHLFQFNETTWGLLIFPAILVLELVVLRKWCHRFCPVSAILSLVSQGNRLLRPRVKESVCLRSRGIDCRACVEACPEQLDPHSVHIAECTKCGQCKERCPVGAISFPVFSPSGERKRIPLSGEPDAGAVPALAEDGEEVPCG